MEEFILSEVSEEEYREATTINPLRLESFNRTDGNLIVVLCDSRENRFVVKTPRGKRPHYFKVVGIKNS